jgi:hypothetical protein
MTEKEELKLFASIIGLLCYEDNVLSTERVAKTNSEIRSFGIIKIEFSSKEKENRNIDVTLTHPHYMTKGNGEFIERLYNLSKNQLLQFSKINLIPHEDPEGLFIFNESDDGSNSVNSIVEQFKDYLGLKELSNMENELLDENNPTKENGISIKESISTIAEMLVLQSRIVKRQTDILSGHYKSKDIKTMDNIPITDEEKLNREFHVINRHIEHMQALREEII